MKTLRFIALIHLALTSGQFLFGATLASLVDARPSVGTFVKEEAPAFLLSSVSKT